MNQPAAQPVVYNKNNPFLAKITENRLLNKEGSEKETRHFILNLEGSGLQYNPGYSIGITPTNPPSLVAELIEILGVDPLHPVPQKDGSSKSLIEALTSDFTLNRIIPKFVKGIVEKLEGEAKAKLEAIVNNPEQLEAYIHTRDYVDVLKEYPVKLTADELLGLVGKINPRLYSIASSQAKHPDEVHLTVAIVRYTTHGREKKGLTTGYLADHVELGNPCVPVFLAPNKHFKLPDNPDTPIIMVGPGTGIAPFRAFLEQREMDGAKGKNWLFFGDQRRATDFLYEEEFTAWQESRLLTRLDTAFSRDQAHKIYVQDKMRENAAEIWKWLQDGAYFYVCGDAKRMAKDVHQALIDIAIQEGGKSAEDAEIYIGTTLAREERRYVRDVY